jgi:hypothetical protein
MGEDGYTDDEISRAKEGYLSYIQQLNEDARMLEKVTGITIGNQEREATKKGFASMSQDSADELNGRFTVIQALTYSITENTKILVANSGQILRHLAGIESNTKYCENLEDINKNISSMKSGIDDINLKGITIKK